MTGDQLIDVLDRKVTVQTAGDFATVYVGSMPIQTDNGRNAEQKMRAFRAGLILELIEMLGDHQ